MTYKEIKAQLPRYQFTSCSLAYHLCRPVVPFLIFLFVKTKVRPNTITLLMIIIGVLAGIILLLPYGWCKLFAGTLYYLWYALDESDGSVARLTQCFSKGGKYLDWCAHLLTHSLFIISMWLTMEQLGYSGRFVNATAFSLLALEMIGRNWIAMDTLFGGINNSPYHNLYPVSMFRYVYNIFVYFPNIVILAPFFLFVDKVFGLGIFLDMYFFWSLFYSLVIMRVFGKFIYRLYVS